MAMKIKSVRLKNPEDAKDKGTIVGMILDTVLLKPKEPKVVEPSPKYTKPPTAATSARKK